MVVSDNYQPEFNGLATMNTDMSRTTTANPTGALNSTRGHQEKKKKSPIYFGNGYKDPSPSR